MTWQYPGLLCSHDKQMRFEKKDRKTWAFRRRTLFFLLITRFIYIRALIGRQIRYKNRSSKTSVVGTVNLWRTRAWRKKYIKFRRKKIEVRSSLLRPFSPGESKSKISLSFCRFFSFSFLRWSIKSNCVLHFQFFGRKSFGSNTQDPSTMKFFDQLKLLVWKNFSLRKRQHVSLI